jgi:hypothetical protein
MRREFTDCVRIDTSLGSTHWSKAARLRGARDGERVKLGSEQAGQVQRVVEIDLSAY